MVAARVVILAALYSLSAGAQYSRVQEEGADLRRQTTLNFEGGGITCANASTKTTCSVPVAVARVSADVSNSSNPAAYANVTGLTQAVTSGSTWEFDCSLTYTASATTNVPLVSVNGPTAEALDYRVFVQTNSAAAGQWNVQTAYDTATAPASAIVAGGIATLRGSASFTAEGTLAIRLRNTTNGAAVTVKRGSTCHFRKLAG